MRDELLTLGLFILTLTASLVFSLPLVAALLVGLLIFSLYGLAHGVTGRKLLEMIGTGIWQARKILTILLMIGILSAVWRCAGTIASLVCYCAGLVSPSIFLLGAFGLNCLVSFLTGTSLGTAATMGVICMAMGTAIRVPTAALGGAILSGAFFGDRCSPVSSSALLVADITGTDIYRNLRDMMKTALVPLLLTCLFYLGLGLLLPHQGEIPAMQAVFAGEFTIHPLTLIPAVLIIVLSVLRVDVRITLMLGILTGLPLCLLMQHRAPAEVLRFLISGFTADQPEVADILNGGGVLSMVKSLAVVCLSSAYSGIFRQTDLLKGLQQWIRTGAEKTTPFTMLVLTSALASAVACSQTLAIMLSNQLCEQCIPEPRERAIALENTAVVIAPLIPWCIAGAIPLAAVGAPTVSLLFAVYLYLIPLYRLGVSLVKKRK